MRGASTRGVSTLRTTLVRCAALAAVLAAGGAAAGPRLDLQGRIQIDGSSGDFDSTEVIFGINDGYVRNGQPCVVNGSPPCPLEEGVQDSRWGRDNDVNQIHVTWDAESLFVAVDAVTWNNNLMLFFDTTGRNGPGTDLGPGLSGLTGVNAWRRNISFANGFAPDLFLATWDGNSVPQIWTYRGANSVEQLPVGAFRTRATFSQGSQGRAMEAAIPWPVLFQRDSTVVSPAYQDTVAIIPAGFDTLRLVACITAGPDGTGSPDSAPDNFEGFQIDGSLHALLDNFAILPLDSLDAAGQAQPDGVPDVPGAGQSFEVDVRGRIRFFQRPPIRGIAFSIADVVIEQGVVSPETGRDLRFRVRLDQWLSEEDAAGRNVAVTAGIFDMRGRAIRRLYSYLIPYGQVENFSLNRWDGRDDSGRMVDGGIYVLWVVVGSDKAQRSFAVVR